MNKNEYYEISTKKNLPLRCPILNYCRRRAFTIYFNSEYDKYSSGLNIIDELLKDGTLPFDYFEKEIDIQGESPTWIRGQTYFYFSNMCPEVNLFDNSNSLFKEQACVEGNYDSERIYIKEKIIKCQHFSECPEFNKVIFDKKISQKIPKKRKAIPQKIKALLQKEIKSKCPFCSSEDVDHFEIHHIDEDTINNEIQNLLMLCPMCHSKITKGDISFETVQKLKRSL